MVDDKNHPKHPHLWIPDEQVVRLPHQPQGREKPRDVHHATHGSALLEGLKGVEEFHNRTATPWADEMIVFTVELAPGQKVQNKTRQEFLKQKGIDILAVQSRTTAIAKASPGRFRRLADKVAEYQGRGTNADFQYIDSFASYEAEAKEGQSIRRLLSRKTTPEKKMDVQIVLLPNLTKQLYAKAITYLRERIRENGGDLMRAPYYLGDGTPVLRAILPSGAMTPIAQEEIVFRIEETAFFRLIEPLMLPDSILHCSLADDVVTENLPVVAVLDSGVQFNHPQLDALVVRHWTAPQVGVTDPKHGTGVSSRVMFGDVVEQQVLSGKLRPRCRIVDGCIFDGYPMSQDELIHRLRAAVEDLHTDARIFNLSFNADGAIDGDWLSLVGYELDVLAKKYSLQFVVSTGNHFLWRVPQLTLGDILDDSDSLLASPADSVLALAVSSISRANALGSLSQADDPSPFARRGPGFAGMQKPDLVAPGGNVRFDHTTGETIIPPEAAAYVFTPNANVTPTYGTSFAAPVVAGDLAQVHAALPVDSLLLAKTLLLHTAQVFWETESLDDYGRQMAAHVFGAGLSRPDRAVLSADSSVTFVRTGELNKLTKERVKFHMPALLADQVGRNTTRVRVTCISDPPVNRSKGPDYCCAYVSASLHRIDRKGNLPASNPAGGEGRSEWQPYQHFDRLFSLFNQGEWEIWLQLSTRWDIPDDALIPYSLAITVEDPSHSLDVYQAIQNEVGVRYQPLHRIRERG